MKNTQRKRRMRKQDPTYDANPVVQAFARNFREWRASNRKTIKVVVMELCVSAGVVSEWEHGHRFPSARLLNRIARYTGIPACQFLCPGPGACSVHRR